MERDKPKKEKRNTGLFDYLVKGIRRNRERAEFIDKNPPFGWDDEKGKFTFNTLYDAKGK